MRTRLLTLVAATIALLPFASSEAGGPVLDGSKRKVITWTGTMTPQQSVTTVSGYDPTTCTPTDCSVKGFVFKPAKGVTGNLLFAIKWTLPAEDVDLFIIDSKGAIVTQCAGFGGNGEALVVPMTDLKAGGHYQAVAHYFIAGQDTLNGIIEFPTSFVSKKPPSVDPTVDAVASQVQCSVDGTTR